MPIRNVEHANLTPSEKITKFTSFLIESGFAVICVNKNKELQTTDFHVKGSDGKELLIHAIIKNVSSGGWSWKPFVKRIQIKTYSDISLPLHSPEEITLLGGFAIVDGDYVYAAWNIFAYMSQNTVRSCYIDAENLIKAHDEGFRKVVYSDNHVYLSDHQNMGNLIKLFIKQNSVTRI